MFNSTKENTTIYPNDNFDQILKKVEQFQYYLCVNNFNNQEYSTQILNYCSPYINEIESIAFSNAMNKHNGELFTYDLANAIFHHLNQTPLPTDKVVDRIHSININSIETSLA